MYARLVILAGESVALFGSVSPPWRIRAGFAVSGFGLGAGMVVPSYGYRMLVREIRITLFVGHFWGSKQRYPPIIWAPDGGAGEPHTPYFHSEAGQTE